MMMRLLNHRSFLAVTRARRGFHSSPSARSRKRPEKKLTLMVISWSTDSTIPLVSFFLFILDNVAHFYYKSQRIENVSPNITLSRPRQDCRSTVLCSNANQSSKNPLKTVVVKDLAVTVWISYTWQPFYFNPEGGGCTGILYPWTGAPTGLFNHLES